MHCSQGSKAVSWGQVLAFLQQTPAWEWLPHPASSTDGDRCCSWGHGAAPQQPLTTSPGLSLGVGVLELYPGPWDGGSQKRCGHYQSFKSNSASTMTVPVTLNAQMSANTCLLFLGKADLECERVWGPGRPWDWKEAAHCVTGR